MWQLQTGTREEQLPELRGTGDDRFRRLGIAGPMDADLQGLCQRLCGCTQHAMRRLWSGPSVARYNGRLGGVPAMPVGHRQSTSVAGTKHAYAGSLDEELGAVSQ